MVRKTRSKSQTADLEAQPRDSEVGTYEMGTYTSGRDGKAPEASGSKAPEGEAERNHQAGLPARSQAQFQTDGSSDSGANDQLGCGKTHVGSMPHEQPRMIGDFDDSANALWSLHAQEAKSHDKARIQSLKEDMDGVLIFAGLFSASLTSFITDKIHELQVDPAQQMVYYQQQNVALLAQISKQVYSIAPQVSIPSTPPPSYPDFTPNSSGVRVNAYWFMSLVFSLSAALLATLVQQWVRDYMHVFQRYSHPLKSARLRQYLYEGVEGWYMPVVAEFVPGLVHVSLFLFFLGLGDSLLALNTTIGITTIIPITVCGLLYIFSTFAPVIYPQSPFQNSFSGLIWYLTQKVHPRRYLDRASGGTYRAVSSNMSEGLMQLAMEENDERKDRDVRSIQWLINNRTEDDEMESFVLALPGSFTTEWGIKVWRRVSEVPECEDANPSSNDLVVKSQTDTDLYVPIPLHHGSSFSQHIGPPRSSFRLLRRMIGIRTTPHNMTLARSIPHLSASSQAIDLPHVHKGLFIHDLCMRVRHLVDTCNNRSLFSNEASWRKRARGCVETVASLVFCADIKLELFGDVGTLLTELGKVEKIPELSAVGSDGPFVMRWTCLSLVATRGKVNHGIVRERASDAIKTLSGFQAGDDDEAMKSGDDHENALWNARRLDKHFETARQFCVHTMRVPFKSFKADMTEDEFMWLLSHDIDRGSVNDRIVSEANKVGPIASTISSVDDAIYDLTDDLVAHLYVAKGSVVRQFIFQEWPLKLLCSFAPKLRYTFAINDMKNIQATVKNLSTIWDSVDLGGAIAHAQNLRERQLWRLQDLRDNGGFGFSVELFFLALAQLSSTPSSRDTLTALYIGTLRALTSDWRQYKHSIGTERVVLNLVCDIAVPDRGIFSGHNYPSNITDELLVLLGNMVEGRSGLHIDDAMKELGDVPRSAGERWRVAQEAIGLMFRLRIPVSSS